MEERFRTMASRPATETAEPTVGSRPARTSTASQMMARNAMNRVGSAPMAGISKAANTTVNQHMPRQQSQVTSTISAVGTWWSQMKPKKNGRRDLRIATVTSRRMRQETGRLRIPVPP